MFAQIGKLLIKKKKKKDFQNVICFILISRPSPGNYRNFSFPYLYSWSCWKITVVLLVYKTVAYVCDFVCAPKSFKNGGREQYLLLLLKYKSCIVVLVFLKKKAW